MEENAVLENSTAITQKLQSLKEEAGSHSPSLFTIIEAIPELTVKVDACFLSNPYATELFLEYVQEELIDTGKIRDILEFYPSQNRAIAELLTEDLEIPSNNIFIGNGAIEIIQAIIHNETKEKLLINIPTFSSYYEFVKDGVSVIFNKLDKKDNYNLSITSYIDLVKKTKPDTIVLINPNNPDGGYLTTSKIEVVIEALQEIPTIIVDESFIHFAFECSRYDIKSIGQLVLKYPNLVVLKSMSKDFGIAGIRAGYALMNETRVHKFLKSGYLWNSNGLAEYFFRLYTRQDFLNEYEKVRVKYIKETQEFMRKLRAVRKIKVYPSMANFVLVELLNGMSSDDFVFQMLAEKGIYLRTCSDKIGLDGEYIRIASRKKEENDMIIDALHELLS